MLDYNKLRIGQVIYNINYFFGKIPYGKIIKKYNIYSEDSILIQTYCDQTRWTPSAHGWIALFIRDNDLQKICRNK